MEARLLSNKQISFDELYCRISYQAYHSLVSLTHVVTSFYIENYETTNQAVQVKHETCLFKTMAK